MNISIKLDVSVAGRFASLLSFVIFLVTAVFVRYKVMHMRLLRFFFVFIGENFLYKIINLIFY